MEVSSYSNFFSHSRNSPPHPREFEFQLSSVHLEKETTTSPADELFYKGKLLPLHFPPRLQMVEKLLENSNCAYDSGKDAFENFYSSLLMTTTVTTPTPPPPFESRNIWPAESCQVSRELNPNEYFYEYSTEVSGFMGGNPKKSWTKKLKLIKQSSLGSKLKASRAYLKSFFGKSGCLDESCTAATKVADEGSLSKAKENLNNCTNLSKKNPFGQIQNGKCQISAAETRSFGKEKMSENSSSCHRGSFSMVIKRHSKNKWSSSSGSPYSSSSNDSNSLHGLQFLKRSRSNVYSEIENSIQGAIAHCKQSQQLVNSRKALREVGFHSLSTSRITNLEDQKRPDLCRG